MILANVIACHVPFGEPQVRYIRVQNETAVPLQFRMSVGDRWFDLGSVANRRQTVTIIDDAGNPDLILRDGCTIGDIVAFGPNGREIARHPPPVCVDETWIVRPDSAAPSATP